MKKGMSRMQYSRAFFTLGNSARRSLLRADMELLAAPAQVCWDTGWEAHAARSASGLSLGCSETITASWGSAEIFAIFYGYLMGKLHDFCGFENIPG